jgi:hypothetical protein
MVVKEPRREKKREREEDFVIKREQSGTYCGVIVKDHKQRTGRGRQRQK